MTINSNAILKFKHNGKIHHALVYRIKEDGSILCFRVVQKQRITQNYIPIYDSDGVNFKYQVQYGCRFTLPAGCYKKQVDTCSSNVVEKVMKKHSELPSLPSLIDEQKELYDNLKRLSPKDTKGLRKKYNELTQIINDRSTVFLQETPKTKANKYRNYRTVPDKEGIRIIYQGGKVSPK